MQDFNKIYTYPCASLVKLLATIIFVCILVSPCLAAKKQIKFTEWSALGSELSYRDQEKGRACFKDNNGKIQAALVVSSESILFTRGKKNSINISKKLFKRIRKAIATENNSIALSKNFKKAARQIKKHLSIKACKKFINSNPNDNIGELPSFELERKFKNLLFEVPIDGLVYPVIDSKYLIAEKKGIIRIFDINPEPSLTSILLDARSIVYDSGEAGLLGFDFDPQFPTKPYIYVNYVANEPLRTVIARFTVSDPEGVPSINLNSRLELLAFSQPFENHNGGQIRFGSDGFLYISVGDGGSANDPFNNGQNLTTLLGSILRIDVSNSSQAEPYKIPQDNPFVGNTDSYREEIFSYGLRNPWRFSVDRLSGEIITADVGQGEIEEIDIIVNGGNYGWKIKEGKKCFQANSCDSNGLIDPIHTYTHADGDNSITGGFVYHGNKHPKLKGAYIFADFVSGKVWALFNPYSSNSRSVRLLLNSDLLISSFAESVDREILVLAYDGKVYGLEEVTE